MFFNDAERRFGSCRLIPPKTNNGRNLLYKQALHNIRFQFPLWPAHKKKAVRAYFPGNCFRIQRTTLGPTKAFIVLMYHDWAFVGLQNARSGPPLLETRTSLSCTHLQQSSAFFLNERPSCAHRLISIEPLDCFASAPFLHFSLAISILF